MSTTGRSADGAGDLRSGEPPRRARGRLRREGEPRDRPARELHAFYELARVVAADPYDGDEVLRRVCGELRSAFGFERVLVARFDADARALHAVVEDGIGWPSDEPLPLATFPSLERALGARGAVLVRDAQAEHAIPASIGERFGVRSLAALPLLAAGRLVGFFLADRGGDDFELTDEDLEFLTAIGAVAAVFVDKADQYARVEDALEDLRRVDVAKSEFVSLASHELRTPIAVVHGIASTLHLRGRELDETQLLDLRRLHYDQTTRLVEVAEQLLDLSRVDAGAVRVHLRRFRPRQWLDTELPRLAHDRRDDIEVSVDPEIEIVTDPAGFERIVSNLVLNALRYGRPPVTVRGTLADDFRLAVEDCGDGVDPEFAPRMFERFTRAERERAAATRGAGLGLAIAHSFARELGGELTYEDASPSGARFVLSLPVVRV